MSEPNSYYDEAYFERGWERGTAYDNYSRGALTSPTYRELAEAIAYVFKPRRCLEIGCATGPIVRHLNDSGIEAYGIDVSEWAVANRLHPNVSLAGADALPFASDHFDLVFSSHSLEHIPGTLIDAAFAEMDRVARSDAVQFHMHPIVGTYPYDYEHSVAIANLQKDPTHNILQPMEWWTAAWERLGWGKSDTLLTFAHDTANAELAAGQMILTKSSEGSQMMERAFAWNQLVHRKLIVDLHAERTQRLKPKPAAGALSEDMPAVQPSTEWQDISSSFDGPIALTEGEIVLLAELSADGDRALRVALVDDNVPDERGVLEHWVELRPGISTIPLDLANFNVIEGSPNAAAITLIFFGGDLRGAAFKATLTLHRPDGATTRLI